MPFRPIPEWTPIMYLTTHTAAEILPNTLAAEPTHNAGHGVRALNRSCNHCPGE